MAPKVLSKRYLFSMNNFTRESRFIIAASTQRCSARPHPLTRRSLRRTSPRTRAPPQLQFVKKDRVLATPYVHSVLYIPQNHSRTETVNTEDIESKIDHQPVIAFVHCINHEDGHRCNDDVRQQWEDRRCAEHRNLCEH